MRQYEVIVGNVGTIYAGTDGLEAIVLYNKYARRSQRVGSRERCAGEPVTLLRDNTIWYEYSPPDAAW